MVLNTFNQTIQGITTCTGNRPWREPTFRGSCYQNLSTISPIDVISKQRSADRSTKHQNGVNYRNLVKIECNISEKDKPKTLKFGVVNARSVCNKVDIISDIIYSEKLDILAICETWITDESKHILDQIRPSDYTVLHIPRQEKRGGGVGIICKSTLKPGQDNSTTFDSFEHVIIRTTFKHTRLTIVNLYRPPSSSLGQFFEDLASLLDELCTSTTPILICGDFNIHVQNDTDANKKRLDDILFRYDLSQHVKGPTHTSGNTLDLVLTRACDNILDSAETSCLVSDHFLVSGYLNFTDPPSTAKPSAFRKIADINLDKFKKDICEKINTEYDDLDSLIEHFDSTLTSILDSHAPVQHRKGKAKPIQPWYDNDIHVARRQRRALERKWKKKPGDIIIKANLQAASSSYNKLITTKKTAFHNKQVTENAGNSKNLFKIVGNLLNSKNSTVLPEAPSDKDLADKFALFFKNKIAKISESFQETPNDHANINLPSEPQCSSSLPAFRSVTSEEIKKYILSAPSKTSLLDSIPTNLIKECVDEVTPCITTIVNKSFEQGYIPKPLKQAVVTPVPKKSNVSEFSNFRPISNLPFLSKLLERLVVNQLTDYCELNSLEEPYQSAYRQGHSTETALLKITNDLLLNMDNQQISLLVLLDMSAAFDTIPHQMFLDRLKCAFGLSGSALKWFESYFTDRSQRVVINGDMSSTDELEIGLPQGSGAGPFGYKAYTKPIGHLIKTLLLDLAYHMFTDDNQLYNALSPNSITSQLNAKSDLEGCISVLSKWLFENRLKLNESKTELVMIGKKAHIQKMSYDSIDIGGSEIPASPCAKNLGVYIDQDLSMAPQINHVLRSCNTQLRVLWSIRRFLSTEAAKTLAVSLILSKLDYCNSLYYGIPKNLLNQLQRIQNSAARFVLKIRKYDHITEALKQLHWLPIAYRIKYKIALITFKTLNGQGPSYLRELLLETTSFRQTRSKHKLKIPRTKLKSAGDRSFSVAAPLIWNSLPSNITNATSIPLFKKLLKTHLFKLAYAC